MKLFGTQRIQRLCTIYEIHNCTTLSYLMTFKLNIIDNKQF